MDPSNVISPSQLEKTQQKHKCKQMHHQNPTVLRQVKIDDGAAMDTVSTNSRGSVSGITSARSVCAVPMSNVAPVNVRDMIRRYNSASEMEHPPTPPASQYLQPMRRQSHYTLSPTKASFSGISKMSSQALLKRESSDDETPGKSPPPSRCGCHRCNSCKFYESCAKAPMISASDRYCCRGTLRNNSSGGESDNCSFPAFSGASVNRLCSSRAVTETKELPVTVPRIATASGQKGRCVKCMSIDSMEEINANPSEASYQSKTTIAKTASGVRITIDIFFDQNRKMEPSDVVGSRVETDIPKSRILSEFQQQVMQKPSNE